jgi:hypothetical protein
MVGEEHTVYYSTLDLLNPLGLITHSQSSQNIDMLSFENQSDACTKVPE